MKPFIIRILVVSSIVLFFIPSSIFAQWSQDIQLSTDTSAGLNENMGQCLAVSGDSVHVVWEDFNIDGGAIFYRHSFDGGVTWGSITRLTPPKNSAAFPSIAVSGATIHVAYRDSTSSSYVSYYLRSLDGGNTWEAPVSLGNFYWWPSVTCDGQMVFVALNSAISGNSEVWFRRSMDNGTTWDSVRQISNAPGRSEDPTIAAGEGYVHLAWNDNRTGIMETWYRRSTDNGVTWGQETQLTNSTVFCHFPILHTSGSNVDLAYGDRQTKNYEIHLKQSTNFGANWPDSTQITNAGGTSAYPTIARDGSNVHLVWWLFGADAFYQHSGDGGATWNSATVLVPSTNAPSRTFIADAGGTLHVIWVDTRSGHPEVYYKNNTNHNVEISTKLVDFAKVDSGSSVEQSLYVSNPGSITLVIDSISISGPPTFTIDPVSAEMPIAPGGELKVSVHFTPNAPGMDSAKLTLYYSSGSSVQVQLTGVSVGKVTGDPASVSTNQPTLGSVEVTPNPASNNALLKIENASSLDDVRLNFYDAAARLVGTQYVGHIGDGVQNIALLLQKMDGISFLRITSGDRSIGTVAIAISH